MDILWFIIGILVGVGGTALYFTQRERLKPVDYVLLVVWLALALFAVSFVVTVGSEPQAGAGRAAMVGGLIFGGAVIIFAVLLGRKILSAARS